MKNLSQLYIIFICWAIWNPGVKGATIRASSASQSHVSAAISAASAGDTVEVPAGTGDWSGLDVNKAVHLRGAGVEATRIRLTGTNSIDKQSAGVVRISGIGFTKSGGGNGSKGWVVSGSWRNAHPVVIQDCSFTINETGLFALNTPGGVIIAGCSFRGEWDDSFIQPKAQDAQGSWTTADTFGTRDTGGSLNHYIEDCSFYGGTNQGIDADDNTRVVYRYNKLMYSSFNSHGMATSSSGVRHWEIYGNDFGHDGGTSQVANQNWLIWIRGGTGFIYNNRFANISGQYWGNKPEINFSIRGAEDVRPQGSCANVRYPVPRQLGQSHDGSAYTTDPIRIYGNTGSPEIDADWSWGNPCGLNFATFWQEGRDYVLSGPKSGYTPYTYPHPLRTASGGGGLPSAPSVSSHPESLTRAPGQSASFTVTASGATPMTYQWQKNQVNISGANSATFTISNVQSGDAGSYRCVVSNSAGSATSNAAVLTVSAPAAAPSITGHPQSLTRTTGQSASFTVTASGTAPLAYQWQRNTANISGANSATFTIANVQGGDAASYRCVVSNSAGTAISNAAVLTVSAPATAPAITAHPQSLTRSIGQSASFSITATGTAPLAYQWQKNQEILSGATSATLTISSVQTGDAASYRCIVSNSAGTVTSNAAVLTVTVPATAPAITAHPQPLTRTIGQSASFTVAASGTAPLTYQWQRNQANIPGATSATFTISSVQSGDAASYRCLVSNSAGTATSSAAALTVNAPVTAPAITAHPQPLSRTTGESASFSVTASGTAPLTYQWQKNQANISGATSATFTISAVQSGDAATYRCVVSNSAGTTTSNGAALTVAAPRPTVTAPAITAHPQPLTRTAGESASFTVTATGTAPLAYQWQKNQANITGATSATLTISGVQSADAAPYRCIVSNSAGTVTSNAAALTVLAAPAQGVYYVDASAGNDSNPGTQTAPWKHCPGMTGWTGSATLSPGAIVYFDRTDTWDVPANTRAAGLDLKAGVRYIGNEWDPRGSRTGRAVIRATGRHEAGVVRIWEDHPELPTWFQGFEINGNGYRANLIDINHSFWRTGLTGAVKRIDDCIAHGNTGNGGDGDYKYGIVVSDHSPDASGEVANVEILNSVVYDTPRDGITLYPGDRGRVSNVLVRGCVVYNTGTDPSYSEGHGLVFKGDVRNSVFESCYVHDVPAAAVFINGSESSGRPGPSDCVIRNSILQSIDDNGVIRVYGPGTKSLLIYGNIVLPNDPTGGLSFAGSSGGVTAGIYNNTFYNSFVDIGNPSGTNRITFVNNIVYETDDVPFSDPGSDVATHSHNLYFRASGGTLIRSGSRTYTSGTISGWESTAIVADPRFRNQALLPAGFQFRTDGTPVPSTDGLALLAGSPALRSGLKLDGPFAGSVNGEARTDASWDRGAYQSSASQSRPAPPANLRIERK